MMKVSRGSKGFTLIELLIVVAIIGILAAIAIPAYTGYTAKARVTGVVNAMGAIKNSVLAYYTESGAVPASTTTAAAIFTQFGVNPPDQYAVAGNWDVAYNAGTNQATISAVFQRVAGDVDGKTLTLTGNFGVSPVTWQWGSPDGLPATYIPKGN